MKKIFSLIVIVAAVAMVGCNCNKKAAAEAEAVEAATEVVEEKTCCDKCDSLCEKSEKCDSTAACEGCTEAAPAEKAE